MVLKIYIVPFSSIGVPGIYDAEKVLFCPILCLTNKNSKSTKSFTCSILFLCSYFNDLKGLYVSFWTFPVVWKRNLDIGYSLPIL